VKSQDTGLRPATEDVVGARTAAEIENAGTRARAGSSALRWPLFAAAAFVALTAIGGGVALVTGLEGGRFPLALLKGTPFSSYVIRGLILAIAVGGSSAVAAAAVLRKFRLGALASIVAGVILVGWITIEVLILHQSTASSWVERCYFAVRLAMASLGLALGRAQ
jgi:hypothetical protein